AITVRNPGSVAVAGVRVEVPLPLGVRLLASEPLAEARDGRVSWEVGNLEAGGSRRLQLQGQPAGPGGRAPPPGAVVGGASGVHADVVRPPFSVGVTTPEKVVPGAPVGLEIQLANHRDTPIQHAVLRAELPPGLRHPQGNLIEADIGSLDPGQV